jgi:alpha-glucosidase
MPEELIGMPFLIEIGGAGWIGITEADLDDYAGMYLTNPSGGTGLEVRLSPSLTEPDIAVSGAVPHKSPWRVMLIGDQPGRLIESNIVMNLNPPSAIKDTSWIKPGKSAWNWWSGDGTTGPGVRGGMDNATMKYYIDFAGASGFEYMLIDAGWSAPNDVTRSIPRIDIPELVRYAAAKNVKVWIWLHWTSVDRQMNEAFPIYEKWGVAGVKIDFMDSNDQRMVSFYHRVAKYAAEHHLMIDYHGAYPPTGMQRTWPNVLTHEGVLGEEYNKFSGLPDPDHNVMIPFTRGLAGPMDYTPGGFDQQTRADFVTRNNDPMVMGTRAHQLALYVLLESPLQMVSDRPSAYTGEPAFDFIKAVPTDWDETRVVLGEVGKYIAIARRHGKEWYVGAISDWSARKLELPLSFLGAGTYTAETYADAPDASTAPKHTTIGKKRVERGGTLTLDLARGGGFAAIFRPM